MITVAILINGQPVATRSAVNKCKGPLGTNMYKVDDGSEILHNPEDGAVVLAKKLLDTIKEVK